MQFSIAEAQKRVGEIFPVSGTLHPEGETWYGRTLVFRSPVSLKGEYVFDSGTVTVNGVIEAEVEDRCSRCGKPVLVPLRMPFSERFTKNGADEDGESYEFSGDVVCLDRMVMDQIFLSYPMTPLCREDCKGLCPVCGADRNVTDCGCASPAPENPFAVLRQITNNDKEV